jgi:hypothetical protein
MTFKNSSRTHAVCRQAFVGLEEAVDTFVAVCWLAPACSWSTYSRYVKIVESLHTVARKPLTRRLYNEALQHCQCRDKYPETWWEKSTAVRPHRGRIWTRQMLEEFTSSTWTTSLCPLFSHFGVVLTSLSQEDMSLLTDLLLIWCECLSSKRVYIDHRYLRDMLTRIGLT